MLLSYSVLCWGLFRLNTYDTFVTVGPRDLFDSHRWQSGGQQQTTGDDKESGLLYDKTCSSLETERHRVLSQSLGGGRGGEEGESHIKKISSWQNHVKL